MAKIWEHVIKGKHTWLCFIILIKVMEVSIKIKPKGYVHMQACFKSIL